MKNNLISLILILVFSFDVFSRIAAQTVTALDKTQDSARKYVPFLEEGKSWRCAVMKEYSDSVCGYYTLAVTGDTIVNGLSCKKVEAVRDGEKLPTQVLCFYENEGKLYRMLDSGSELICDITLHPYDDVIPEITYIDDEDSVLINGEYRKMLFVSTTIDGANSSYLGDRYEHYVYYVVEGIGVDKDLWCPRIGISGDDEYTCVISCSMNRKVIYTFPYRPGSTSIKSIYGHNNKNNGFYDLSGRKLNNVPQGTIFIKDGKKILNIAK